MYYVHLMGNFGYIYLLLPGNDEWTAVSIAYCQDFQSDLMASDAMEIRVPDLPDALRASWGFGEIRERIWRVWRLT
jgi:hypothetical protein